jgi:hypothetical protein
MRSLGDEERQAVDSLDPELHRHAGLALRAFDAIGLAFERAAPEARQSRVVTTILLTRLANDLRCVALLALRGYPLQAATLVASMFEGAYAVAYIGGNDTRAQEWLNHDDPTTLCRPVRRLVLDVLAAVPIPDAEREAAAQRKYRDYGQLCLPKHLNPLLQRQHGLRREGADIALMVGPTTEPDAIRVAWFALEQAAGLAAFAASRFVQEHVPADPRSTGGASLTN